MQKQKSRRKQTRRFPAVLIIQVDVVEQMVKFVF